MAVTDLFSERRKGELSSRAMEVSMAPGSRHELFNVMVKYNVWSGWERSDSLLEGVFRQRLERVYRGTSSETILEDIFRRMVSVEDFIMEAPAENVFDAIEIYCSVMFASKREAFEKDCAAVLDKTGMPFGFVEGYIMKKVSRDRSVGLFRKLYNPISRFFTL